MNCEAKGCVHNEKGKCKTRTVITKKGVCAQVKFTEQIQKEPDPWTGKKTICFDFDGVISEYNGWPGKDVFKKPIPAVINAMRKLKEKGYYVIIWTTRENTPALHAYLHQHNVPYDSINSRKHNPPETGAKPIYHAFIDDRAIQYRGQDEEKIIRNIEHLINNGAPILENEKKDLTKEASGVESK